MRHVKTLGRLGELAVGLGLGAAAAVTPGVAVPAPPDIDIAMGGVALAAMDFDISIWGFDFSGGGTAHATSTFGNIAIAIGGYSRADAEGGFGDVAYASDTATSPETGAIADAGNNVVGANDSNFDVATALGNESDALAGPGSFDSAFANGFGSFAAADGGFSSATVNGMHSEAEVGGGIFNSATVNGNLSVADAGFNGSSDTAAIDGNNDRAEALNGFGDQAFVCNVVFCTGTPGESVGSDAFAGGSETPGNYDLAGVIGDGLTQNSIGDFISHIAPLF